MRLVMKFREIISRIVAAALLAACAAAPLRGQTTVAAVKVELTRLYAENNEAYQRGDLPAVMRLRAPDFHSLTPDGRRQDRAAMENYTQGIMNGVRKWNSLTITIDSLQVVGDTAFATVSQHLDRTALRSDNEVHHVETWVVQRETWVRHGASWLMWRVDQLRNQRRLVDGKSGP
jgi:ketosteroid isomerase-like protein